MATKVFMEALSPTREEGRLVKWLKNEGDAVKSGEPLAEVETDKAIMELVARGDGVLRKRLVNEGESRPVGQLVGVIATKDENIDALLAEAGGGKADVGGGKAEAGGGRREAEATTKSAQQAKAPEPPAAVQAQVSSLQPPASSKAPASSLQPQASQGNGGRSKSSPLARRIANERGVDI